MSDALPSLQRLGSGPYSLGIGKRRCRADQAASGSPDGGDGAAPRSAESRREPRAHRRDGNGRCLLRGAARLERADRPVARLSSDHPSPAGNRKPEADSPNNTASRHGARPTLPATLFVQVPPSCRSDLAPQRL
jgi:hypothetical protein